MTSLPTRACPDRETRPSLRAMLDAWRYPLKTWMRRFCKARTSISESWKPGSMKVHCSSGVSKTWWMKAATNGGPSSAMLSAACTSPCPLSPTKIALGCPASDPNSAAQFLTFVRLKPSKFPHAAGRMSRIRPYRELLRSRPHDGNPFSPAIRWNSLATALRGFICRKPTFSGRADRSLTSGGNRSGPHLMSDLPRASSSMNCAAPG
mmetsp:Transcript_30613/g.84421  ORF Transcript_30613/g.84421 Transcript_30613/m.84421 type:complete len:207 (+) Transcript_30613:307-927(+)